MEKFIKFSILLAFEKICRSAILNHIPFYVLSSQTGLLISMELFRIPKSFCNWFLCYSRDFLSLLPCSFTVTLITVPFRQPLKKLGAHFTAHFSTPWTTQFVRSFVFKTCGFWNLLPVILSRFVEKVRGCHLIYIPIPFPLVSVRAMMSRFNFLRSFVLFFECSICPCLLNVFCVCVVLKIHLLCRSLRLVF